LIMDDVRYSELVFLQKLATGSPDFEFFRCNSGDQLKIVGLHSAMYVEMAAALLEDLVVRFDEPSMQLVVARLRKELSPTFPRPSCLHDYQWANPRETLQSVLTGQNVYKLRITYRGLRRVEELRDVLRRDRILEHFGVLLDLR